MGEVRRSLAAYRSFTVTQTYLWGSEIAFRGGLANPSNAGMTLATTANLAASLVIPLTLSGALLVQLKEITDGNDPLSMQTPAFWGKVLLAGGGLGIFGDFLSAGLARNGKTSAMTALGAPTGLASDLWDITGQEGLDLIDRATNPAHANRKDQEGRRVTRFFANNMPWSSLVWARTAYDRAAVSALNRALDPDADEAFARRARQLERDTGQRQWWEYGHALPSRAPDPGAAFRGPHDHPAE